MLIEPVLVDTGPLLALYSEEDVHHAACQEQVALLAVGKAYTCWPVITEVSYMLRKRPKQREEFLQSVTDGELVILKLRERDLGPVGDIFKKYHDQEIELADACLLHLADRENINAVFTLDRRHFGVFRRLDGAPLRLLPESG